MFLVECVKCVLVWLGWVGGVGERNRFGLFTSCRNRGSVGRVSLFWVAVGGGGLGSALWCYVCVCCDYGIFV